MKKVFLSAVAVIALAGATTANANTLKNSFTVNTLQDTTLQESTTQTPAKPAQTPVKLEELPDAIKTLLTTEPYKPWNPTSAQLVKPAEGAEYYRVEVQKGEEKAFLKIDKDGKVLE